MKLKKRLFLIYVFVLVASQATALAADATIAVKPGSMNPHRISEYLNGGFIEFLLDYVNGPMGLWAQEIQDRGFEEIRNPNQSDEEFYHWRRYSALSVADLSPVQITAGGYNKSDRYQLQITAPGNIELGLSQRIWLADTVAHKFYIWTKGESAGGTAKIVLLDTAGTERLFEQEIAVSHADWQKIEFDIPAIAGHYTFDFTITYQGAGTAYFDEASIMPANNFHGIRKEWENYIRLWGIKCLRYPGGSFADMNAYRWEYLIGDIDQRKSAIYFDKHDNYTQRCDFGIKEYIRVCKELTIEPVLVLNMKQGAAEGTGLIEYCNGSTATKLGQLRAQHDQAEPYNVKIWEITNELYFQAGTAEELAAQMLPFVDECDK